MPDTSPMSDSQGQQKVMAAIMLALRESCDCEPCQVLRSVADDLITQLRMPSQPTAKQHPKKIDLDKIAYKTPDRRE